MTYTVRIVHDHIIDDEYTKDSFYEADYLSAFMADWLKGTVICEGNIFTVTY